MFRARLYLIILLLLLVVGTIGQPATTGKKYLLAIGVPNYTDSAIDSLKFPGCDALNFWDLFKKGYLTNLAPENTKILINDSAKYSFICDALSHWLLPKLKHINGGDMVFIYWSGHGVTIGSDQQLFCADTELYDLDNNKLDREIDLSTLKTDISHFSNVAGVKTFLIVDACRNKKDNSTATNAKSDEPINDDDIYLLSTAKNGHSYETSMLVPGSSVFTYFLVNGLLGGADRDVNNQVKLYELTDYLGNVTFYVQNVLKEKDFQVPQPRVRRNPNYGIVLTELPKEVADANRKIGDSMRKLIFQAGLQQAGLAEARPKGLSIATHGFHPSRQPSFPRRMRVAEAPIQLTGNELYDSLLTTIRRKQLVEPDGHSAYDYFVRLAASDVDPKLVDTARSRLFIALIDDAQGIIDDYLDARLVNATKHVFEVGALEFTRAISLSSSDDPIAKSFALKVLFLRARALAGSNDPNDWNEGLRVIDSSIKKYPHLAYLYHTKGMLYSLKRRYNTAIQYFDSAAGLAPNWLYPMLNLANEYFLLGEQQKSIFYCQKIIQKAPGYSRAYSALALNYESLGTYDSAIYWNNYSLKQDSSNPLPYLYLGRIYLNNSLAKTHLPDINSYRYFRLGAFTYGNDNCLAMLGKYFYEKGPHFYDSAKYYYQLALQRNPFSTLALSYYTDFLIDDKLIGSADSLLRITLRKSGYDYQINSIYRAFVFRTGSRSTADSIFRSIVSTNSEDPYIFLEYSRQVEVAGNIGYAKDILLRGINSIGNSVTLYQALGQLYLTHYQYSGFAGYAVDSSIFYFSKAKAIDPGSSLTNLKLSEAFKLKGYAQLSSTAQDQAIKDNMYILKSASLNNDPLSLANHYLQAKNYDSAIRYYQTAENNTKEKFPILVSISRCYYLKGKLDSALMFSERSSRYIFDIADTAREHIQSELQALIDFDKRQYTKAARIWLDINESQDQDYDLLDEALCNYKVSSRKNPEKWQKIIKRMGIDLDALYQKKISLQGTFYSDNYVNELTSFVMSIRKKPAQ